MMALSAALGADGSSGVCARSTMLTMPGRFASADWLESMNVSLTMFARSRAASGLLASAVISRSWVVGGLASVARHG